ncbi:MAG: GNAT family N-acetyltransferase [Prevotella sp.]|jgi:predicted N-acetyltransferase YhbS
MLKNELILRPERPSDYRASEELTRNAFWNVYAPGCYEHYLLHVMRQCPDFLPELCYVAVREQEIVGHIAYLRSSLLADDSSRHAVLCLGPISVSPPYQRKGVGRMLINQTCDIAASMGFGAVFLYGDPEYYQGVGFRLAEDFNIRTSDNLYANALLARELKDGFLSDKCGRFVESRYYQIDTEGFQDFDSTFPHLEKVAGTPTQIRFQQLTKQMRKP